MTNQNINTIKFKIDVSRTFRNKEGDKEGNALAFNNGFRTEEHTPSSFVETVIKEGWSYTMNHLKRSPEESGAIHRNAKIKTPRHIENFVSHQVLTGDDDREIPGVIDHWLNHPFFSQYGFAFVESVNSTPSVAEKGHPILIFDRPITDPDLWKECMLAFNRYFPTSDQLIRDITRVFHNAVGARIHELGNICPFDVFEQYVLEPYREEERRQEEERQAKQAERQAKYEVAKRAGLTVTSKGKGRYLEGYINWIFDNVRQKNSGRNLAIYVAGRQVAAVETTPWAQEFLHLLSGVESRIVDAAAVNGYLAKYANNNPNEVLRVFNRGRAAGGEPLDEPVPRPSMRQFTKDSDNTITLQEGQYLGDVITPDDLPRRCNLVAQTGTGKTTLFTQWASPENKVLMVFPTRSIINQQLERNPDARACYENFCTVESDSWLIFTTPDSLPKVLELIGDPENFTVVIDEDHNFGVAGYRKKAYTNAEQALDGSWKRVARITGTPVLLVGGNFEVFETVVVDSPKRKQPIQRIVYAKGERLATAVENCDPKRGVQFVLLDHKEGEHEMKFALMRRWNLQEEDILIINNELTDTSGYATMEENEVIPDGVKVVISTRLIAEGFNIQTDIDTLHLVTPVSSVITQQMGNRFRKSAPGHILWYNRSDGEETSYDLYGYAQWLLERISLKRDILQSDTHALVNTDNPLIKGDVEANIKETKRTADGRCLRLEEDAETGERNWVIDFVGLNNRIFDRLKNTEHANPAIFKVNTAQYGMVWSEDVVTENVMDDETRTAVKEYKEERKEEKEVYLDYLTEELKKESVDVVRQKAKTKGAYNADQKKLANVALQIVDIVNDFKTACDLALETDLKTRRENTLLRRLRIQRDRGDIDRGVVHREVYREFRVGERLTSEEVRQKRLNVHEKGIILEYFAERPNEKHQGDVSARGSVLWLRDYFDIKQCKITLDDGTRVYGHELVGDSPTDGNGTPLFDLIRGDVSKGIDDEIIPIDGDLEFLGDFDNAVCEKSYKNNKTFHRQNETEAQRVSTTDPQIDEETLYDEPDLSSVDADAELEEGDKNELFAEEDDFDIDAFHSQDNSKNDTVAPTKVHCEGEAPVEGLTYDEWWEWRWGEKRSKNNGSLRIVEGDGKVPDITLT